MTSTTRSINGCQVHTDTFHSALGGFVARVAAALVAADHVDALTVPAQPVAQVTLVDIWEVSKQRLMFQRQFAGGKNTKGH